MANEKDKTLKFELAESYFCTTQTGERLTFRCVGRTNKKITLKDKHYDKVVKVGIYASLLIDIFLKRFCVFFFFFPS